MGPGAVHVERLGRGGPAVVLLHGFGTCAFLWRALAPRLAEAGYTVAALDLLGHGESDRPADVDYRLAAQADYLERTVTALRLGEASVIGQDMGALVALLFAARHPQLVSRLVLLEPLDPDDLPGPAIRSLQRTSAFSALSANSLFGTQPLLEPLLRRAVTSPARMPDRLVARYLAPFTGGNGAAELLQLASTVALRPDDRQRLTDVRGDVMLWCGAGSAHDEGAPVEARVARWQHLLPEARIRPIIAAHSARLLVPEEAPEALTPAILAWLAYGREGGANQTSGTARH